LASVGKNAGGNAYWEASMTGQSKEKKSTMLGVKVRSKRQAGKKRGCSLVVARSIRESPYGIWNCTGQGKRKKGDQKNEFERNTQSKRVKEPDLKGILQKGSDQNGKKRELSPSRQRRKRKKKEFVEAMGASLHSLGSSQD